MSPLWLVSVLALCLVMLVATSPVMVNNGQGKDDTDVGKVYFETSCHIKGQTYQHGEIFSDAVSNTCARFQCINGDHYVVQDACDRNGTCVPPGDIIQEKCRSLRCTTYTHGSSITYRFEPTFADKCAFENRCVRKNIPFMNSDCVSYRCVPTIHDGYRIIPDPTQPCNRNGTCVPLDGVVQEKCRSLRCTTETEGNSITYRFAPTSEDKCEVENRCVRKSIPFLHSDCAFYICLPTIRDGYNFVFNGTRLCQDDNGKCFGKGVTYQKTIDGHFFTNCHCHGRGVTQCRD